MEEFRSAEFVDAEVTGFNFHGLAAVFDSPWRDDLTDAVGYVETLSRGAIRKALSRGDNVPLLGAHRRHELLASTGGGTLQLAEDARGLVVDAELPQNYLGEYYREMISRGDIRGMSYGRESKPEDSILTKKDNRYHRSIAAIRRLLDVTLTWEPAYEGTVAELRAAGFAAFPLQELVGGLEEQTGDAVEEAKPPVVSPHRGRMAELLINELEKGGWPI